MEIGARATFECSNGGEIRILADAADLDEVGLIDGTAFWSDLYINPYVKMTLDIAGRYGVEGNVKHVSGDTVMSFQLNSRSVNGTADIRMEGLKSNEFYRLEFDGILAETDGGRAHEKTGPDGTVQYNSVVIPNE